MQEKVNAWWKAAFVNVYKVTKLFLYFISWLLMVVTGAVLYSVFYTLDIVVFYKWNIKVHTAWKYVQEKTEKIYKTIFKKETDEQLH